MSHLPDDTPWAVNAWADAALGDPRRTKRVMAWATALAPHPTAARPEAGGAIEPPDVLHSHIEATYRRLATVPVVWAVQEPPEVDWPAHPATKGLGPLGHTARQGWHVHSTLAVTPERYVWATVEAQPVGEHRVVQVPRRGAQPAREAMVARAVPEEAVCHPVGARGMAGALLCHPSLSHTS